MDELKKLAKNIVRVQPKKELQTFWAKCTKIEWDKKTMSAVGINDSLEVFNVSLGLGDFVIKPKTGSICLLGIIENEPERCFLIQSQEIEEIKIMSQNTELKIDKNGFLLKKENETLKKLMGDLIEAIKNMSFMLTTPDTINGTTTNLINIAEFIAIKNRFNQFLKDN